MGTRARVTRLIASFAIALAFLLVPAASITNASGIVNFVGEKPLFGPAGSGDVKLHSSPSYTHVDNYTFPDGTNWAYMSLLFNYAGTGACFLGQNGQPVCANASGPNTRPSDTLPKDYCSAFIPFACTPPVSTQDCSQPGLNLCYWVPQGIGEDMQKEVLNGGAITLNGGTDVFSTIYPNTVLPDAQGYTLKLGVTNIQTNTIRFIAYLNSSNADEGGCFTLADGNQDAGRPVLVPAGQGAFMEWNITGALQEDTIYLEESACTINGQPQTGNVPLGAVFLELSSPNMPSYIVGQQNLIDQTNLTGLRTFTDPSGVKYLLTSSSSSGGTTIGFHKVAPDGSVSSTSLSTVTVPGTITPLSFTGVYFNGLLYVAVLGQTGTVTSLDLYGQSLTSPVPFLSAADTTSLLSVQVPGSSASSVVAVSPTDTELIQVGGTTTSPVGTVTDWRAGFVDLTTALLAGAPKVVGLGLFNGTYSITVNSIKSNGTLTTDASTATSSGFTEVDAASNGPTLTIVVSDPNGNALDVSYNPALTSGASPFQTADTDNIGPGHNTKYYYDSTGNLLQITSASSGVARTEIFNPDSTINRASVRTYYWPITSGTTQTLDVGGTWNVYGVDRSGNFVDQLTSAGNGDLSAPFAASAFTATDEQRVVAIPSGNRTSEALADLDVNLGEINFSFLASDDQTTIGPNVSVPNADLVSSLPAQPSQPGAAVAWATNGTAYEITNIGPGLTPDLYTFTVRGITGPASGGVVNSAGTDYLYVYGLNTSGTTQFDTYSIGANYSLTLVSSQALSQPYLAATVGHFTGRQFFDFAGWNPSGVISVFQGTGIGTFTSTPSFTFTVNVTPITLQLGTLPAANAGGMDSVIMAGDPYLADATFNGSNQPVVSYYAPPDGPGFASATVAPLTPGGLYSVVAPAPGGVLVGLQDSANGTLHPFTYIPGTDPTSVAVGDFNGDGAPDIATITNYGTVAIVLNSNSSPTAARVTRFTARRSGSTLIFRWCLASTAGVAGFDLFADVHRLNPNMIAVHDVRSYHYTVQWPGAGPFTLRTILASGGQLDSDVLYVSPFAPRLSKPTHGELRLG